MLSQLSNRDDGLYEVDVMAAILYSTAQVVVIYNLMWSERKPVKNYFM